VIYLLSCVDLGRPKNITVTGGLSFDYKKKKSGERPERPQMYRDAEAGEGVAVQGHKTGADSPITTAI